jgi:hypothetical protein
MYKNIQNNKRTYEEYSIVHHENDKWSIYNRERIQRFQTMRSDIIPYMQGGKCNCSNCILHMKSLLKCNKCNILKPLQYFDSAYILKWEKNNSLERLRMQGINSGRIFNKNDHFEVNCGNKIDLDYTVCIDCGGSKKLDKMFNYSKKRKIHKKTGCCDYCHRFSFLTLEHMIPKSEGGEDNINNYSFICTRCNSSRKNIKMLDWMDKLPNQQVNIIEKYFSSRGLDLNSFDNYVNNHIIKKPKIERNTIQNNKLCKKVAKKAAKKAVRKANRKAVRKANRKAVRKANRKAVRKATRKANRKANKKLFQAFI